MILRRAGIQDLAEMDSLRRSEQEAVGFVPLSRWERDIEVKSECFIVGHENEDMVAYLFWTRGLPVAAIQQIVVRSDARRDERGSAIVRFALEIMAADPRRYGVTCRARLDLAANTFWEAIGFRPVRLEETGGRRGPAMRYYYSLRPALVDLGLFLPDRRSTLGSRIGFRKMKAAP